LLPSFFYLSSIERLSFLKFFFFDLVFLSIFFLKWTLPDSIGVIGATGKAGTSSFDYSFSSFFLSRFLCFSLIKVSFESRTSFRLTDVLFASSSTTAYGFGFD
jgi:hypothetical protein